MTEPKYRRIDDKYLICLDEIRNCVIVGNEIQIDFKCGDRGRVAFRFDTKEKAQLEFGLICRKLEIGI